MTHHTLSWIQHRCLSFTLSITVNTNSSRYWGAWRRALSYTQLFRTLWRTGLMALWFLMQVTGGVWTFSRICCDVFVTMDVMMCTASILNLCAISIDRWVPGTYRRIAQGGVGPRQPWKECGCGVCTGSTSILRNISFPSGLSLSLQPWIWLSPLCARRCLRLRKGRDTQAIKHYALIVSHILIPLKVETRINHLVPTE